MSLKPEGGSTARSQVVLCTHRASTGAHLPRTKQRGTHSHAVPSCQIPVEKVPTAQVLHPQGNVHHELHQRLQGHKLGREIAALARHSQQVKRNCASPSFGTGETTSRCCAPFGAPQQGRDMLEQAHQRWAAGDGVQGAGLFSLEKGR